MSLPKLNPVEPPWYGPVCPVVGEGWHREVSPYPDLPLQSRHFIGQAGLHWCNLGRLQNLESQKVTVLASTMWWALALPRLDDKRRCGNHDILSGEAGTVN